jgi:hypothetical protein
MSCSAGVDSRIGRWTFQYLADDEISAGPEAVRGRPQVRAPSSIITVDIAFLGFEKDASYLSRNEETTLLQGCLSLHAQWLAAAGKSGHWVASASGSLI